MIEIGHARCGDFVFQTEFHETLERSVDGDGWSNND
jgi:hypothetical protein